MLNFGTITDKCLSLCWWLQYMPYYFSPFRQSGSSLFPLYSHWWNQELVQHLEYVFQPWKSHTLTMSPQKELLANHPIYFLQKTLEKVSLLKHLGIAISHDLSWADHVSKLASKASRRLSILHCARSFLVQSELLTTFLHSLSSLNFWQPTFIPWPVWTFDNLP